MVVVILLLEIEMVRSIKLHVGEGWVNSHSSPCQLCMRCLNSSQSSLFFIGSVCGSQMPKTSSINRL